MQALSDMRGDRQASHLTSRNGRMARIGLMVTGSVLALVVIAPATWAATDEGTSDADVVFCLSPAQRPHLIDAAEALGLGRATPRPVRIVVPAGRELAVDEWKRTRPADFQRTCAALVRASRTVVPVPSAGLRSILSVLLPVVVGAVLTGVTTMMLTSWKDAGTRRRSLAGTLRSAVLAFHQATETYLGAWTGDGDPTSAQESVRTRRFELISAARRVADEYHRWQLPRDLQDLVSGDELGEGLAVGWHGANDRQRGERAVLVRAELHRVGTTVERIAEALELPRRPRWTLRKGSQERKDA